MKIHVYLSFFPGESDGRGNLLDNKKCLFLFTQHTGNTPTCSNSNCATSTSQIITVLVQCLPSAALFSVASYFLALLLTKQCWRYMDPFILLHLMLYNLCTQAQELCYLSSAVFRWELHSLAGKLQRQMCQNCVAQLTERVVHTHGNPSRRLDAGIRQT